MLTVRQALQLSELGPAQLIAGAGGLDRPIQWVHVLDIPAIVDWAHGGELLFTTAFGLKDDPDLLQHLIPALVDVGVVGLAVNIGPYLEQVPPFMCEQADRLDFPLITLPWEVSLSTVTRAIAEVLVRRRYRLLQQSLQIYSSLTQVALVGGGLDALAHSLAGLLHCPITVEDADFCLLAHAPWGEVDRARCETISGGRTSAQVLDGLQRLGYVGQLQRSLHPVHIPPLPDIGLQFERLVAPIIVEQERLGYVWVISDGKLTGELEQIAVEHAATVAALILMRERAVHEAQQRLKSGLLNELLDPTAGSATELAEQVRRLGLTHGLQVLVLEDAASALAPPVRLLALAERLLKDADLKGLVVEHGRRLFLLLGSGDATAGQQLAARLYQAALPLGCRLAVGVGRVRSDVQQLGQSYQEAREALQVCLALHSQQGGVRAFDDLGLYHWLNHLPAAVREANPFRQVVAQIAACDEQHGSELLKTLEAYLDSGGNAQQAANCLFVHRNTLRQRLARIEEQWAVDLGDSTAALNLHIAIKDWRLSGG